MQNHILKFNYVILQMFFRFELRLNVFMKKKLHRLLLIAEAKLIF